MITQNQFEDVVKNYETLASRVEILEKEVNELKEQYGSAYVDENGFICDE